MSTTAKLSIYEDDTHAWRLIEGDALAVLAKLPDNSIDAIVTDPPYGISFAGNAWDGKAIRTVVGGDGKRLSANEVFARWTRIWATEALRVLKPGGHVVAFGAPRTVHALTRGVEEAGLEIRDQLLWMYAQGMPKSRHLPGGLGTCLRPAFEPIVLARKPLAGTTLRIIETWGTGALNTEASRVNGRWPAHVVVSHGERCSEKNCVSGCPVGMLEGQHEGFARMFFVAKATRAEREAGLEDFPVRSAQLYTGKARPPRLRANQHPTVKPIALMRWLVGLVTPVGGVVCDPFAGSGTTGIAAVLEKGPFLGIEREPEYVDIACARLTHHAQKSKKASS